jgi:hypothetical protein
VAEGAGGDVGRVYLLLIDTLSGDIIAQVESGSLDGLYQYQFANIPEGSYELHAVSDTDND